MQAKQAPPGLGIARDLLEPPPRSRREEKEAAAGGRREGGTRGLLCLEISSFGGGGWGRNCVVDQGKASPECKESEAS